MTAAASGGNRRSFRNRMNPRPHQASKCSSEASHSWICSLAAWPATPTAVAAELEAAFQYATTASKRCCEHLLLLSLATLGRLARRTQTGGCSANVRASGASGCTTHLHSPYSAARPQGQPKQAQLQKQK